MNALVTDPAHISADYSVLWGSIGRPATQTERPFANDMEARAFRDAIAKRLKAVGYKVTRHTMRSQQRPYWGYGVSCGRVCNVYHLEARK